MVDRPDWSPSLEVVETTPLPAVAPTAAELAALDEADAAGAVDRPNWTEGNGHGLVSEAGIPAFDAILADLPAESCEVLSDAFNELPESLQVAIKAEMAVANPSVARFISELSPEDALWFGSFSASLPEDVQIAIAKHLGLAIA